MKVMYIDTETTGLDHKLNGLVQIAGIVEIDGVEKARFDFKMKPVSGKQIDGRALEVQGITLSDLDSYSDPRVAYNGLTAVMDQYADRYDKTDKFWFVAYNAKFDEEFVRQWFLDMGDVYFGSWFWTPSICAMVLSAAFLGERRLALPNFKLETVARSLGLEPDGDLHDAMTDINLTRRLMAIVAPEFGR